MKIAIVGTGISGNVAAYHLNKQHDITVYEANSHIGGHTHTHDITVDGKQYNLDTGFIVFNYWTYPHFTRLLDELGVAVQKSEMSFSVKCHETGLEYNGNNLNSLFAQRRNLLNPYFYKLISDILRFNKQALDMLAAAPQQTTLGEFLAANQYSEQFISKYIIPMGAAIWSQNPQSMFLFPAQFFIRFFKNHGLLSVNDRPDWYVIKNGSRSYVDKLVASFQDKILINTAVKQVKRTAHGVFITDNHGHTAEYDYVLMASHADQTLRMLVDKNATEQDILSNFPYQENKVVLHTDTSILPKRKLAWASWNYHIPKHDVTSVPVTYNMNRLQSINADKTFCVTLNDTGEIDERNIIKTLSYDHPLFTPESINAQQRLPEINGRNRTYYCGAYWRNGFHEDGVVSALTAINQFNEDIKNEQRTLRRAS